MFKKMGIYKYVTTAGAEKDPEGKRVKAKWVRSNKGTQERPHIRRRLVAQLLGNGARLDELCVGTPSVPGRGVRCGGIHRQQCG